MCGICGAFAYRDGAKVDETALLRIRDSMATRGPDGSGEWSCPSGRVWLGHRRLAIIDLTSNGAQPMASDDGSVVLTFNGEIYNFRQLRESLQRQGYVFRSTSDTEVLLQLYRQDGPGFISKLRGMFAFALWDEPRQTLFCARDPYGIKPFYYADAGGIFSFASQVKALVLDPRTRRRPDPAGVTGFFLFGSVPEPWTVFESVKALPAGSTLTVDRTGAHAHKHYYSLSAAIHAAEDERTALPTAALQQIVREALLDSVRHHLIADVPVGVFLSAGVDSGSLVGLIRDAGQTEIRTITLSYEEFQGSVNDEAPLAAEIARFYATNHTTRVVSASEFHNDLPKILQAMDQPSIDGINTWFVSKASHEAGLKVAISGVGGDELFGGYSTFQSLPYLTRMLHVPARVPGLATLAQAAVRLAESVGLPVHPKLAGLLRYGAELSGTYLLQRGLFLPEEMGEAIADKAFVREGLEELAPFEFLSRVLEGGPKTDFGMVSALESSIYLRNQLLRDSDWASMAHSLELRTPLVDHYLLEAVAPLMIAGRRPSGKALLAAAPSRPLPDEIVRRPKTGFGIPVQSWIEKGPSNQMHTVSNAKPFSRGWARSVAAWQQVTC
nr:asparagine synthase (glutamine-hydrolyzing) [Rhodovulum sp. PH10]